MTTSDLRPASDWEAHFGVKIIDPDGWRMKDGVDWDTPIDEDDFRRRYAVSTVKNLYTRMFPPTPESRSAFRAKALRGMQAEVREVNEANGWYESKRSFGEDVALLHSEASEMLEAYRDWGMEDHTGKDTSIPASLVAEIGDVEKARQIYLEVEEAEGRLPKPEGVGSEAADLLIRLLNVVDVHEIDLPWEFERKLAYNRTRTHRHGGKCL